MSEVIERIDSKGNMFFLDKHRTPHFDYLHNAEQGSVYELCGEDCIFLGSVHGEFIFMELDDDVELTEELIMDAVRNRYESDIVTVLEFDGHESWLKGESVIMFDPMGDSREMYEEIIKREKEVKI